MTTAITTRTVKGSALLWTEEDANFENLRNAHDTVAATFGLEIASLQAAQTSGTIGFTTVALMNADLNHNANTLAIVTNDATQANNVTWIKLGASGTGSWQKSNMSPFLPFYDSRNYTDIADWLTIIGSTVSTLFLTSTLTVVNNATIPITASIVVLKGGNFNISSGKVLTVTGSLIAGKFQIFSGMGTVANLKDVYPEWWGAIEGGVTNCTIALQAAYASGGKIKLSGRYLFDTLIINTLPLCIEGTGPILSILQMTATSNIGINFATTAVVPNSRLSNFLLQGNSSNIGGISLGSATYLTAFTIIDSMYIQGFTGTNAYGICLNSVQELNVNNSQIIGNYDNIYCSSIGYCTSTTFSGSASLIGNATHRGVNLAGICQIAFKDIVFEANDREAIYSSGYASDIRVEGGHSEGNMINAAGTATFTIIGSSAAYASAKFVMKNVHIVANYSGNPTGKQLYLSYVFNGEIYGCEGLFSSGGVYTTAYVIGTIFRNNADPTSAIDIRAAYRALLGTITVEDYSQYIGSVRRGPMIYDDLHFLSIQPTAPTISVGSVAGIGATAVLSLGATDFKGQITLTAGSTGMNSGTQLTVTFNKQYYDYVPLVFLTAGNSTAGYEWSPYGIAPITTGTYFQITFGAAMTPGQVLIFNYLVMN
jgi:hypothetical protein